MTIFLARDLPDPVEGAEGSSKGASGEVKRAARFIVQNHVGRLCPLLEGPSFAGQDRVSWLFAALAQAEWERLAAARFFNERGVSATV